MGDAPKLTDAEYGYLRSLTETIRLDMMKVHHLCDFSHGLDHITPKGRAALEAYDAEQRAAIAIEALEPLRKVVEFYLMCRKDPVKAIETGALRDAAQWILEEAIKLAEFQLAEFQEASDG